MKAVIESLKRHHVGVLSALMAAGVSLFLGLQNNRIQATKDALSLLHATVDGMGGQIELLKGQLDECHIQREQMRRQLMSFVIREDWPSEP